MKLQNYKDKLGALKLKKQSIESDIDKISNDIASKQTHYNNLRKAHFILIKVSEDTQKTFKAQIEKLVLMVIQAVYTDRNFTKFILQFEEKRNQLECTLLVQEGDYEPENPKNVMGGGMVDLISFAMRIVLWSMEKPRSRNVFFLDEPLKNGLDKQQKARAIQVFKEISEKLNIQLIIITHDDEIKDIADKSFDIVHNGKFSEVVS